MLETVYTSQAPEAMNGSVCVCVCVCVCVSAQKDGETMMGSLVIHL